MRSDRIPSTGDGIVGLALLNDLRVCHATISTEKLVTACIKTINRSVYRINSEMVTALTVFGLVIDCRTDHFDLTGIEVTLIVCHIVHGIPKTEFNI